MRREMSEISKMLSAAHEIKKRFDDLLLSTEISDSGEARVSASLFLTISEQFAAMLCLIKGGFSSHAPIIVRSMLEGLANLRILANDPTHLDQLKFDNARSDLTMFRGYIADPDMQEDADAIATLSGMLDIAQSTYNQLSAAGFKKQEIQNKFQKAHMLGNYVAYRTLCSFAHNQLTTLIARHAGKKFELRYHDEAPLDTTASVMTVAISILCQAAETTSKFSDLSDIEIRMAIDDADTVWCCVRT